MTGRHQNDDAVGSLVESVPDRIPGLLRLAQMERSSKPNPATVVVRCPAEAD
jgi:hypothetical protein